MGTRNNDARHDSRDGSAGTATDECEQERITGVASFVTCAND
jgi:hypothetical protein